MREILQIPADLREQMKKTFRSEAAAKQWLKRPAPAFGGASPAKLIQDGRASEVLAALRELNQGFGGF